MTPSPAQRRTGRRGFTLVELLLVIVIIGVLAGILVPSVMSALKQAYLVQCKSNLKQIATAVINYSTDYNGFIPPTRVEPAGLYWCNILAQRDLPAPNTSEADDLTPSTKRTVMMCPACSNLKVTEDQTFEDPDDAIAQGWFRIGNDTRMTDCSYYWNGYVGTSDEMRERFLSLSVNTNQPKTQPGEFDCHNITEIPQRSNMAMVMDGIFWQNTSANVPQRIAARHPGTDGERRATNVAFYDTHVEMMDRAPDDNDNWRQETVIDPETEMIPILSRQEPFEGGPPYFLLPKR